MKKVIVLGGYGNFGKRIVENLARLENIAIYIAGRSEEKAKSCINGLSKTAKASLHPLVMDIYAAEFSNQLQEISPFLVIHTSGPFQGQNYTVPQSCIGAGAHYIDLADDRRFVCDITQLDGIAKENNVLAVSGASLVPGLASTVVESYSSLFSELDAIDLAIAPGNKAERGLATVAAILSYTGHPISVFKSGSWQDAYGWMDSRINDFGGIVGKRHLANVDVPDLEIFPTRYNVKNRVSFQAGLELPILHNTMVAMAKLSKIGVVKSWAPLAKSIVATSNILLPFGSDSGAMEILLTGTDIAGVSKKIKWTLYAPDGNGPYIRTLSTIILAKKLISGELTSTGATPCVGLFTLTDFERYFNELGIFYTEEVE